ALGVFAHRTGADRVAVLIESNNATSAQMSRVLVERQFADWTNGLGVFAGLPQVRQAVVARDEAAVREQLRSLVEGRPHVVRAFVTDPAGLLWADFPRAPESLGKRFAHRD